MKHSKKYAYGKDYVYCKGTWKEGTYFFKGTCSRTFFQWSKLKWETEEAINKNIQGHKPEGVSGKNQIWSVPLTDEVKNGNMSLSNKGYPIN